MIEHFLDGYGAHRLSERCAGRQPRMMRYCPDDIGAAVTKRNAPGDSRILSETSPKKMRSAAKKAPVSRRNTDVKKCETIQKQHCAEQGTAWPAEWRLYAKRNFARRSQKSKTYFSGEGVSASSLSSLRGMPRCSTEVEKTIWVRVRPNFCRWLMNWSSSCVVRNSTSMSIL